MNAAAMLAIRNVVILHLLVQLHLLPASNASPSRRSSEPSACSTALSGISAAVVDTKNIAGMIIGGVFNNLTTQSGTVNVVVNSVATRAQVSGTALATYASVNASISTVNGLKTGNGGSVVLNGQTISVSGSDTVQTLINKINNLAGTTGVSADFTSGNGSGAIVLTQQNYGANFSINESESSPLLTGTGSPTLVKGTNATVTVITSALVNGVVTSVVATFTGGRLPPKRPESDGYLR